MRLLLVVLFLGAVSAVKAVDPTTICFPGVFQMEFYNMITGDKGTIFVDFSQELWAEVSSVTGIRTVSDFSHLRSYVLTRQGNDTVCQSFKLRQDQIMRKCLPPYTRAIPEASGKFNEINLYTWDIPTDYNTINRLVLGLIGTTYRPIMSQQYGYHGTTDMYLYLNHAETISNQNVFNITADCDTRGMNLATIVG